MLQIDGLNMELLHELDHILNECGLTSQAGADGDDGCSDEQSTDELEENSHILDLTLDAFIGRQANVSTRLFNAITTATSTGSCPFPTIGHYVRCASREMRLQEVGNIGRGSASEFERLVVKALRASSKSRLPRNARGYVDLRALLEEAFSALTSRQQEVLTERFVEKKTLEGVAASRNVTRERIRQIEAKSLRVLAKHGDLLEESAGVITSRLDSDGKFELSVEEFSSLVSCEIDRAILYLALLKKLGLEKASFGLFGSNVFIRSRFQPRETWKTALVEEIENQPLPLNRDSVMDSLPTVPRFYVLDYFERKWGAQTVLPSSGRSYRTTRMCVDVLRKARRPLHTSDVRALIYEQFAVDVQEHAINATLGRNDGVVITGPGTYSLYECLSLSKRQVQSVRELTHEYLLEKGRFISSKILFDEVFSERLDTYTPDLNHYMVMGIVQDDSRFVTKRGTR